MIDLLSDTVTQPTPIMRQAIAGALVGDDGYGEDPTVNRLEAVAAKRLGKEAACLMPSGTMANLSALITHCARGTEVLVGDKSDIYNYEAGGVSAFGGLVLHPVATLSDGRLDLTALMSSFRDPEDSQCAPAGVVCVENPHNLCGGRVLALDHLEAIRNIAQTNGVAVHLDGARIFNAERAQGTPASHIAAYADSVQFCLSKSLAAPIGSVLCGTEAFIGNVRRLRKVLGGTMRQAGFFAAAGLVAMDQMIDRLDDDHRRAKRLAEGLAELDGIVCDVSAVETNMVYFGLGDGMPPVQDFLRMLQHEGVRLSELGAGRIRAALHHGINDEMVGRVLAVVRLVCECSGSQIR